MQYFPSYTMSEVGHLPVLLSHVAKNMSKLPTQLANSWYLLIIYKYCYKHVYLLILKCISLLHGMEQFKTHSILKLVF